MMDEFPAVDPFNLPSAEVKDCQICGQIAHGYHFGVLSCRPCAAFFKRCIIHNLKFICLRGAKRCSVRIESKGRKCKSCRLQMCKIAGMVYHKMEESSSEGSESDDESFNDNEPMSSSPNLDRLAKTYVQFLAAQRAILKDLYPKNAPSNGEFMTVPFEHMHAHFQQETKQMLIWMFKKNFSSVGQKQHLGTRKMLETTIDACFGHLSLLSACYLTLKHLPARTDNRFFTAYGHLVFMDDRLDTVLWQLASNASNSSEYYNTQKRLMDKKFMFVQNLRNVKIKIQRDDFTVLMAIIFCIKASSVGTACMGTAGIWEQYKETIMAEWFQRLRKRFRSTKEATIQIAWLVSLLTPLDMIFTSCQETMEFPPIPCDPAPASNVLVDKISMESNELAYLLRIASAHEKVRSFYHQIPQFDLDDKYDRLESLLGSTENFLAMESLKFKGKCDADQIYWEIERNRQHPANTHPRVRQSVIYHRLLAIGCLKAMPIFRQLTSEEQSILTQNMFSPLIFFTNFYYSVKMGARTLAGPDGVATINIFRIRWGHDNCVMTLAEKTFTRGVAKFGNIPLLDEEEFALLLAILCTHSSAIPRLSAAARNLLYAEQSHYSGLLMRHLQRKLGFQEGAKRYADCIDLIEVGFYADHKLDLMRTYLALVRGAPNGCFIPPEYPKCLLTLKP